MRQMTIDEYIMWTLVERVRKRAAEEGIEIIDKPKKPINIVKLVPKEYEK